MKIKLTKEEFIKRSMAGDVFEYNEYHYFYDVTKTIPFRFDEEDLLGNWDRFDGKTEFNLVIPENTKLVKEWMYKSTIGKSQWFIVDKLMTVDEAKEHFMEIVHEPTGREFRVEVK